MHALKVFILISFLLGPYLKVNAGDPLRLVELKGSKVLEQVYVVKKPVNNITLTNPAARNTFTTPPQLYLPNRPHQGSDWVLLRDNMGRVINLGHLVGTGIIDLPRYNHTNAGRVTNSQPNDAFRKRDIVLVSTLSALCIAGLVLGPVINSKKRSIRYKYNAFGTYVITLAMNNELDLMVKF